MNIKKIKKLLILLLAITMFSLNKCYAGVGISVGVNFDDDGEQEYDEKGNPQRTIEGFITDGNKSYTCQYSYTFNYDHQTEVDIFNQKGESIIYENENEITFKEGIKAGTSVGMKITETKNISWSVENVTVTGVETEEKTVCNGTLQCCSSVPAPNNCREALVASIFGIKIPFLFVVCPSPPPPRCVTFNGSNCSSPTCNGQWVKQPSTKPITNIPAEIVAKCRGKGEEELSAKAKSLMGPSYKVKLRNPNYIDAGEKDTKYETEKKIVENIGGSTCGFPDGVTSHKCTYSYNVERTCMDAKTGKVRYKIGNELCSSNEITIEPKNNKWQYFVPLDTNSKDTFGISLVYAGQDKVEDVDYCKKVVDKKDNYWDYIKDVNNNPYPKRKNKVLIKEKIETDQGCRLDTEIKFDIEQKFYNELENGNFKGFNFYYKPIPTNLSNTADIEKTVFPNGITEDSLWKQWYEKTKNGEEEDLDLTKNEITYIANIYGNVDKIRNENSPYTTWDNMNVNGSSKFIKNNSNIFEISQSIDYYKLGCGPSNADWSGCK